MFIRKNRQGDGAWRFRRNKTNADDGPSWRRILVAVFVWLVEQLVFGVILCPLAALYMCGLLITTGLSVWRLVQRDYGTVDDDVNLRPALNVLYSLALFQGVLFCYRFSSSFAWRGLVGKVAEEYKFGSCACTSVKEYLREMSIGCEKDPSFADGRNLVSYAVRLMNTESSGSFLSGARILDTLLEQPELSASGQHGLIRQLVVSASSTQLLHKLLQTLDSTRAYDTETRERAARIVAHLAGDIRLEQFPRGIHCIASLLEAPGEEEDDCAPVNYKELMRQGLRILGKLAANEDCCRDIGKTEGLVIKIMEPLRSDLLHREGHGAWFSTVFASMEVMCRLMTAPGETGEKLRREISSNMEVMTSMRMILKCGHCDERLLMQAFEIYTQLLEHTSSTIAADREFFIRKLTCILTDDSMDKDIRELAGEKLAMLSSESKANLMVILQAKDNVIGGLTKILEQDKSNKCRTSAARILEQLCIHHTDDDDFLTDLKEALKVTMPKVLTESLTEQNVSRKILAAFLSLSVTMLRNLMNEEDLACQFDAITCGDSGFRFPAMLEQMVKRNSDPTVNCLKTLKLTTEIFMLMVGHGGSYTKEETWSLMKSLSEAATIMSNLEGAMIISNSSSVPNTLNSLVKEAQEELQRREKAPELELVIEHPSSVNENQTQ